MRKFIVLLFVGLLIQVAAFADVGFKNNGSNIGSVTDIDTVGCTNTRSGSVGTVDCSNVSATSATYTGDVTFRSSLLALGRTGNSTVLFSSSTKLIQANIPYALILKAILGAEPTTYFPKGTPGQVLVVQIYSVGQSGTWSIAPDLTVPKTGWTSIQFNAVGQSATFVYLNDTLGWIITATGSTASTADPTITTPTLN